RRTERPSERPVQLDHHDGVVAITFRVRARSGLRVAVNRDGAGDARQSGSWPDGVRPCPGNVEADSVSARVSMGRGDRLAQGSLSVITNAGPGVSRRVDDESRACLR